MDGRGDIQYSGSASYYLNRGISGSGVSGPGSNAHGSGGDSQAGGMHSSTFRSITNPNFPVHVQNQNVGVSGGVSGSSFHVENPSSNYGDGINMTMVVSNAPQGGETVKKKRGRPRKYGPDGSNMSLGSPDMSASKRCSGEITPGEKTKKGRPPGTGWKQQLAHVGEWMNKSAGLAFTPHVLHVGAGEDIAAKILAFAQQRPRALCVMSANGAVSTLTLRQPDSDDTVTFEGRFEILCLSGSYLLAESGSPRNRTGGISISVCTPDGQIIGGVVGGKLIASNPIQVVACSFVYGGGGGGGGSSSAKAKSKPEPATNGETYLLEQSADTPTQVNAADQLRSITPKSETNVWPSGSQPDRRNSDIDLTCG